MSIRIIKGGIFKVKLANGVIRYFQFVGKDKSELNSDVIAIFKNITRKNQPAWIWY